MHWKKLLLSFSTPKDCLSLSDGRHKQLVCTFLYLVLWQAFGCSAISNSLSAASVK
jgi:hypothetical protein